MSRALSVVAGNAGFFPPSFVKYLGENLHVYEAFEKQALMVAIKGHKHYSARTIVEVLRHHSALQQSGGEWKLNNDNTPYLARLFTLMNPGVNLFEFRSAHATKAKQIVGSLVSA